MKTVLVVISRSENAMCNILAHCIEKNRKHIKDEYVYVINFDSKDKAREYMCFDLIRDDLLGYNERVQKYKDRTNEFNFRELNISIRTGNEMKCFVQ